MNKYIIELLKTFLLTISEETQQWGADVPINRCDLEIIIKDIIDKISERQQSTEVSKQYDSKSLSIADVSKQRELLIAFASKITYSVYEQIVNDVERYVDNYIKSNL